VEPLLELAPRLEELVFSPDTVSSRFLNHLIGQFDPAKLTTLRLSRVPVDFATSEAIARLTRLIDLMLFCSPMPIGDDDPNATEVSWDPFILPFTSLKSLERLSIMDSGLVFAEKNGRKVSFSLDAVAAVLQEKPNLRDVDIVLRLDSLDASKLKEHLPSSCSLHLRSS